MNTAREQLNRATTESQFMGFVIIVAERYGWHCWHDNDSRRNRPGLPDLLLVREDPPDVIVAELKSEGGKVTKAQEAWLRLFAANGIDVRVWRPSDSDAVIERLRTHRSTQRSAPQTIDPANGAGNETQAVS